MITSQKIASLLNEVLAADPQAMYFLMCAMGPANKALLEHPTIVVKVPAPGQQVVGWLGVLQGVTAMDGHNIWAVYEDRKLIRFDAISCEECQNRQDAEELAP